MQESVHQKALRLHRQRRVRRVAGDTWEVNGDTGTHRVNAHKQLCSCPSRVYCSHRAAVAVAVAKLNAATARELERARNKPRRQAMSSAQIMANLGAMGGTV